jgi:hypothetical protein
VVKNLLSATAIGNQGQAVSEVRFTISNSPGTDTSNTAAGQLVNIGSGGSVTLMSGTPGNWISSAAGFGISGKTITLETVGGSKPNEMIMPASGSGSYPSMNSGSGSHNPYVDGPATFTLNLTGVTGSTKITAVTFGFGTSPDSYATGTEQLTSNPEPSTLAIAGVGALGFVGYGLRKRHRRRKAERN